MSVSKFPLSAEALIRRHERALPGTRGQLSERLDAVVLDYLTRAVRRDAEKGGSGTRSTVEVAEQLGTTTAVARSVLVRLEARGEIDWLGSWGEGFGNAHRWRLTEIDDPDDGEEWNAEPMAQSA